MRTKSEGLTPKQEEVLVCVKKFIASHGYPPSVREICKSLDLKSPATVQTHLVSLKSKGYISNTQAKFRTLEIVGDNEYIEKKEDLIKVPLLGKVTAGSPIEAIERANEFFDLPASLVPKRETIFTLEVSGESMINAGIYDNDIVIVQRQNVAKNGDIIVAMTEENEVTLKRFYKEKGHIRLQPENDKMDPIILQNVTILGKAIGLYRKL